MKDLKNNLMEKCIDEVINLPSMEIARTIAVETIDYPYPSESSIVREDVLLQDSATWAICTFSLKSRRC